MGTGVLFGVMKCSKIDCGDDYTALWIVLKTIELQTLHGQIIWYMNDISINAGKKVWDI